ncbi:MULTISPECIES: DUF1214 domain-containing protein [Mycobacteriaceae]|uniref:DUF1214 domain-containing protein n=1 Tax=Mycolicibacterium parafortuitum TaxID=39692 RepID=A0ACC6MBL2_MYCPF|nr:MULTISPECIES: DUF1214 domain-containing protein [Mycobacteriaceae]MDZ5084344.1 DUF1214 domain-containing protein [Mycolicibacterium parafortuitum]GFM17792.1 uncharacterized protein PO1_contig-019-85 [Mycobacterium sp. PO1]GFM24247.1 uncharacterized protein PO2_contig-036-102 [Mycobacterium sp. PO2]
MRRSSEPVAQQHQPRPALGYATFIGRVGALAVFLGVGSALAIPAAHADTDGAASSESSSESASSASTGESGSTESSSVSASSPSTPSPAEAVGEDADEDADVRDSEDLAEADAEAEAEAEAEEAAEAEAAAESDDEAADEHELDAAAVTVARTVEAPAVIAEAAVDTESDAGSDADDPQVPAAAPAVPAPAPRRLAASETVVVTEQQTVSADAELSNQVSPLGTPQQIEREKIAMSTAKSLPVALMKIILRFGFLAAAKEQFALVGGPDAANREALDNAIDEYALAASFQQQILNPLDPAVVTQVAPPHSWYGIDVGGSRLLYDNPDTIYRFIAVNKTSEYVLTGRIYDGIPADTTFSVLEGTAGTTSTILTLPDLDINDDGSFVITVSGDPAAPGQTNHLQLTSRSTLIAARNTLGDWNVEDPMELAVQRVAGPRNSLFAQLGGFVLLGGLVNDSPFLTSLVSLIPPLGIAEWRPVRGTLAALLLLVRGANEQAKYMALATTDPDTGELRQPNVMTQPASNAEFLANQLQSNGYFQLADDEALVLTIDPGNAGFFTVPVYNDWTITDDYWNEQTSLNDDQSVANADGTYTLVVSVADPGVANWVSTGGLNQGIISMRFQNLDPQSPAVPSVQSVVVKLEDLEDELPAGTVFVTPQERAVQLAARKAGYDKRWAPYPQV